MRTELRIICGIGKTKTGTVILPEDSRPIIRQAMKTMAKVFGGVSVTRMDGGWIDDMGELVEESSVSLSSFVDMDEVTLGSASVIVEYLRDALNQDSVLLAFGSVVVYDPKDERGSVALEVDHPVGTVIGG